MAERTIWTCDKCHSSWSSVAIDKPPLARVMLMVGPPVHSHGYTFPSKSYWKAYWCEDCLRKVGIPEPAEDAPAVEPVTLEDMVRDIIAEVIDGT